MKVLLVHQHVWSTRKLDDLNLRRIISIRNLLSFDNTKYSNVPSCVSVHIWRSQFSSVRFIVLQFVEISSSSKELIVLYFMKLVNSTHRACFTAITGYQLPAQSSICFLHQKNVHWLLFERPHVCAFFISKLTLINFQSGPWI